MSASKKLTTHLGKKKIEFEIVPHRKVYTAYDLAQTVGTKLEDIAKTLLIKAEIPELKKVGKHHVVIVVPASYHVDMKKVKKLLKAKKVEIISEKALAKLKIKPGTLTPFGSTKGFRVLVDKSVLKSKHVLMGAESYTESLRVKVKDFVEAEEPLVGVFGKKNKLKLLSKKGVVKKKTKKKKGKKPAKKKVTKKKVVKKPAKKKPTKKKVAKKPVKKKVTKKSVKKKVAKKKVVKKKAVKRAPEKKKVASKKKPAKRSTARKTTRRK